MTASPFRAELERHLGDHVFARWENDARTFTDAAAEDLVAEQRLADEYYAVLGAARTPFRGADASLGELARYADHPDRGTRRDAAFAIGALFDENAARLDDVFDGIVRTRAAIAAALGERGFIDVAYRRRGRVDYGASDAARFRDDIRAHVVPLASEIVRR
ncbi:MAG TPA: hypothetical protein VHT53_09250, partial [Candidatus Elarobacter sp.]|nr:hypothetical protein [Candidatus Elarobacter sp.]